ncbi:MAG TPA: DUF4148 domain-containing protein [Burkholderiaceae bacterium]|nr:DUF4148 domain-containing protein [Burkholderiaceae bacterium]
MKSSSLIAIASLALLASVGARADEADGSQYALKFESTRARAEVLAEARIEAARADKNISSSSVVAPRVQSKVERAAVRAEAVQAVRSGLIPRGEAA